MYDDAFSLPRRRRLWPIFVLPVLVLIAAAAWSGFWFYAASQVDERFDGWRTREARSGRTYDCADRSVAGFPFRLEVKCSGVTATLVGQAAGDASERLVATLKEILVIAQVYTPRLLIAEFTGPFSIATRSGAPFAVAGWTLGEASVAGIPGAPERVSLAFDAPAIDRIDNGAQQPFLRASHLESHTRLLEGSLADHPVIETVLQLQGASVPGVHPVLAAAFDGDIRAQLRGLKDLAPKPWPQRFREIQAAGGRLEITESRLQQGDTIAVAAGSLSLTPTGHLDGQLQMTVAGLENVIALLGIDKMLAEGVPQSTVDRVAPGVSAQDVNRALGALDRLVPGLANVARQRANAGVAAGVALLGQPTTLENRKALALPLKFVDGAVFLGPLKVAQTPPLF